MSTMDECLSALYGGACTADAVLVVKEEEPLLNFSECPKENLEPAIKRQRTGQAVRKELEAAPCATMLAHKAVLWPLSEFFQSKFQNWSSNNSTADKPEILILVPAGQIDIGKALVITMYDKLPGNLEQQQLLQLLCLAESYKIHKVVSAVIARLSNSDLLELETVSAIYQLPTAEKLYQPLAAAARRRLLQVLGDFELIWALEQPHHARELLPPLRQKRQQVVKAGRAAKADRAAVQAAERTDDALKAAKLHEQVPLHTRLLQLPFNLLLELVSATECRVASEDTVFYTIDRWLQQNATTATEQRQQLAKHLRLRFCTPSYLVNEVCSENSWLVGLLPERIIATETALCIQPDGVHGLGSWTSMTRCKKRSASVVQRLELSWKVAVQDIAAAYRRGMQQHDDYPQVDQKQLYRWQGREFHMKVGITQCADPSDHEPDTIGYVNGVTVGVEMSSEATESIGHGGFFSSRVTAWKAAPAGSQSEVALQHTYDKAKLQGKSIEEELYLMMAIVGNEYIEATQRPAVREPCASWPEVEQALMHLDMVHHDDCIHLSAVIWDPK